jgi:hypothetical protein
VDTLLAVEASNVGPAVCAQHELQSRLGEEGKPRDIVGETEELPAIEELVREMRVDEETAPAVDEGEPNRAVDGSAVPGVPSGHGRRPIDLVVAHAVVVGRMISTAWPRFSSSRLRPKMTSPNPPACATGAHSEATILPRTRFTPYRPSRRAPCSKPTVTLRSTASMVCARSASAGARGRSCSWPRARSSMTGSWRLMTSWRLRMSASRFSRPPPRG